MGEIEWHRDKALRNRRLHGVSFEEAESALRDRNRVSAFDIEHSEWEARWITVGFSYRQRLVTVVTGETPWGTIRIISAWRATKRERHGYITRSL